MQGTINSVSPSGDIKINWTDNTVWFDYGDATTREKKHLIKYITKGRKNKEWDAYVANPNGEPSGPPLKKFPKNESRIVIKRKSWEVKSIIEDFVDERIESMGYLVYQQVGKEHHLLRKGDFKVKTDEELKKEGAKKQEVTEVKRPGAG